MTKIRKIFASVIAGAMALSLCGGVASAARNNTAVITLESTVIAWDGATGYTIPITITGSEDCHALSFGFTIEDNMELDYDGYDTLVRDGNNWLYGFSAASDRPADSIDTFNITLSLSEEDIIQLESGENVSYTITTTIRNFVTGELNGVYNEYEKENISSVDAVIIITPLAVESDVSNDSDAKGTLMLEDATIDYVPGTTTYKVMLPLTCDVTATAVGIGILTSEEVVSLSRQSDGTLQYSDGLYWYSNARASGWESGKIIDVFMVTIELTDQDIAALNRGQDITISVEMTKMNALGEISAYISEEYSGDKVNIKDGSVTLLGVEGDYLEVEDSGNDYLLGDVDGDGVISPVDAYDVLLAYANVSLTGSTDYSTWFTSFNELAADVDGDGSIVPNDAYYILAYYSNEQLGLYPTWEEIIAL